MERATASEPTSSSLPDHPCQTEARSGAHQSEVVCDPSADSFDLAAALEEARILLARHYQLGDEATWDQIHVVQDEEFRLTLARQYHLPDDATRPQIETAIRQAAKASIARLYRVSDYATRKELAEARRAHRRRGCPL